MSGMFLSSVSGLRAQQSRLDSAANNLANLSTTGYKATRLDLAALPQRPLEIARAGSTPLSLTGIRGGVALVGTTHSFTMGGLQTTTSSTDLAILGEDAFFQVQTQDGSIAYTRDGQFSVDGSGQLVTANGDAIEPPVRVPAGMTISHITGEGVVMGLSPNSASTQPIGVIELARFPNPNGLLLAGGNRYVASPAAGAVETGNPGLNGFPQVASGVLEASNVDLAEQSVTLIEAQRAYAMNLRAIQTLDEMIGLVVQTRS